MHFIYREQNLLRKNYLKYFVEKYLKFITATYDCVARII